ncbi:MAG: GTP 3',8-cyclase MoaA [Desulfobulbaceae bacterium]|nr:GTP 3',8-cyclase MoaA [Desulfobulbaceae bacterium]
MRKYHSPEGIHIPYKASSADHLFDNHGRRITYLRLAITDRCNLRCRYCRPETGVPFIPHDEILSLEEYERLVEIFCALGVSKVRVTGGEPFSRRGCMRFLTRLRQIEGVQSLYITTNGVKTHPYLDELKNIPIDGINLSLDTLNPQRFAEISRRDYLESVLQTMHGALDRNMALKINSVVLEDTSDEEIIELSGLARKFPLTLRFIEIMPFSGTVRSKKLNNGDLLQRLQRLIPQLKECKTESPTTSRVYSHPDFNGMLGIIQGHSRNFCKTCNKVRITPAGMLKTCLYDKGVLDLKGLLRSNADDQEIGRAIVSCVRNRFVNGHEAERLSSLSAREQSMAAIGG